VLALTISHHIHALTAGIDVEYSKRLRTLLSVEDAVVALHAMLVKVG
jgi:hypothetical protein